MPTITLPNPGDAGWATPLNTAISTVNAAVDANAAAALQIGTSTGTAPDALATQLAIAGREPALPSGGIATQFLNGLKSWVALTFGNITGFLSIAQAAPSSTFTVNYNRSTNAWPLRPSARSDISFIWSGPDPSPTIVESGTAGMLDNVDYRFVTVS